MCFCGSVSIAAYLRTRSSDGLIQPHFYGELAKTDLGCQVLADKGHFAEFAHFIRQHALEGDDFEIVFKLKSVLWAVVSVLVSVAFFIS